MGSSVTLTLEVVTSGDDNKGYLNQQGWEKSPTPSQGRTGGKVIESSNPASPQSGLSKCRAGILRQEEIL